MAPSATPTLRNRLWILCPRSRPRAVTHKQRRRPSSIAGMSWEDESESSPSQGTTRSPYTSVTSANSSNRSIQRAYAEHRSRDVSPYMRTNEDIANAV